MSLFEADSGAIFSPCRSWRYVLWRQWEQRAARACNFIMLNPSTADELENDATIRRCIGFAKSWGYTRLVVTNIFAFRATLPDDMKRALDPIGADNDVHIVREARRSSMVVCAWGNHGTFRGRGDAVLKLLRDSGFPHGALKVNASSKQPAHPLYLKGELTPVMLASEQTVPA